MIPQSPPICQVHPLKICLFGSSGRMGQRIEEASKQSNENATITLRPTRDEHAIDASQPFNVIVDFSSEGGTKSAAALAIASKCALLVGTTGLSAATHAILKSASMNVAVLKAPNTSIGIIVMRALIADAARMLGSDFKISITEVHHTKKLDRPSGTALALADAVARGRGEPPDQSQIHSIRTGDVVGDHDVVFTSENEVVTLRHHAKNRDLFAVGAIRLAHWIARQPVGMYGLDDLFNDRKEAAK
ncbi:MAG: 4-hydroxy-tetrahydrodipicolinate reductase [Phycisphaerales bacterium]|nr:4-hydroxy-tetrahydrodipicolinate reductase [Phycisphaerales bacterium]